MLKYILILAAMPVCMAQAGDLIALNTSQPWQAAAQQDTVKKLEAQALEVAAQIPQLISNLKRATTQAESAYNLVMLGVVFAGADDRETALQRAAEVARSTGRDVFIEERRVTAIVAPSGEVTQTRD